MESRARYSWERFLLAEQRALEARRNSRMAKSLAWRLPGEAKEELDTIASEDRRRAKDGLVELRDEQGAFSFKQVEELSPEDRMECIRAELARIEWLLERHERCNAILRSHFFEQRQSRRSVG